MPPKRQSILDKISAELPEAAPSPATAAVAAPARKRNIVPTSIYIPAAVHERLREIAFSERCKMHDLIMEGLDRVIADRGHPERTKAS